MPQHRHRHDPSKTLVGFRVGDVRYAIAIADVREICNPLALIALPHAPAAVHGVTDYRGEVIPVIDLRTRFGLEKAEASRRIKWVVVHLDGHSLALVVDQMLGVFGTSGEGLRPSPSLGGGDDVRGIEGVTTNHDGLVFVVDLRSFRDLTRQLVLPEATPGMGLPAGSLREDDRSAKVSRS
jgi:purine-binding chemotaxis protein CheW